MITLNEHQWQYLISIFNQDQEQEEINKKDFFRGRSLPAKEWRKIEYYYIAYFKKSSYFREKMIKEGCKINQGTGSTFIALKARGLIELEEERRKAPFPVKWFTVTIIKITQKGRKLVREKLGIKREKSDCLSEAKWERLLRVFLIRANVSVASNGYIDFEYVWQPLINKGFVRFGRIGVSSDTYGEECFLITEKGERFIIENYTFYKIKYPEITANYEEYWERIKSSYLIFFKKDVSEEIPLDCPLDCQEEYSENQIKIKMENHPRYKEKFAIIEKLKSLSQTATDKTLNPIT
jgi:predicted transcriptional regulator